MGAGRHRGSHDERHQRETLARAHRKEAAGKRAPFGSTFPIGGHGANRWRGETVVVVASGPSFDARQADLIAQAVEAGRAQAITCNTSAFSCPWAGVHYGSDAKWWTFAHPDGTTNFDRVLRDCSGEPWTTSGGTHRHLGERGMQFVQGLSGVTGLSRRAGAITFGGNSGHAAVGLAYHFGARRIVLVGFDMQHTGGRSHHHGDHPRPLKSHGNYRTWCERFKVLARDLERVRVEVVNATRETALECFPRVPLEVALCPSSPSPR